MDDEGISAQALAAAIDRHAPRLLYTIPSAHNPTGLTTSEQRRREVVELARANDVLVLADEVYHLLRYDGAPPQPMAAHVDSGVVVCLNTFSKILAPGLRLGWIQAAEPLVARLEQRGYLVSGGGLNPFTAALVADVLDDGTAAAYLEQLRAIFAERITVMDGALRRHLPAARYITPTAGYFFWLRLGAGDADGRGGGPVDTAALRPRARELGAGFQPGPAFSATGGLTDHLRLSFAYYGTDEIETGVEILGRVFSSAPTST
jgi:DNA-binding transcriptional MocR family regulator